MRSNKSGHRQHAESLLQSLDFSSFDADGDESIDIGEFVMNLERIYQRPAFIEIVHSEHSLSSWIRLNIVETETFSLFVLVIVLIELILFLHFGLYPGTKNTEILDLLLGLSVLLNGLDIAVKICSMRWDYYWNTSKCRIIHRHRSGRNPASDTEAESDGEGLFYEESVGREAEGEDALYLKQREFAHRFDLVIVASAIFIFAVSRVVDGDFMFSDASNRARIVMVIPLLRLR